MMSHTMLAMGITAPGGPEVLQPVTLPVPVPGHGQIVFRVAFAGVNRPDVLQRQRVTPGPQATTVPDPSSPGRGEAPCGGA